MLVDVRTQIEIARPRAVVAEFAADPERAPVWHRSVRSVDQLTPGPLQVGSRFSLVSRALGRGLVYTYEVGELEPGERLAMRTTDGPFPLERIYEWADLPGGATRMTLRSRGDSERFGKLTQRLTTRALARSAVRDLHRLKRVLERGGAG